MILNTGCASKFFILGVHASESLSNTTMDMKTEAWVRLNKKFRFK